MDKICIYCENREIDVISRKMCMPCYVYIRKFDCLPEKPPLPKKYRNIKFAWRLKDKYGEDIVDDILILKDDFTLTLQRVGDKYGVTREYIRQIYKKLTGEKYTKALSGRRKEWEKIKNNMEIGCTNNPLHKIAEHKKSSKTRQGAIIEQKFINECNSRNLSVEIPCKSTIDLKVNGYNIEVKSNGKARVFSGAKIGRYLFCIRPNQYVKADFFACYHTKLKTFFIIPKKSINQTKNGSANISFLEKKSRYKCAKNRYWEYKDAWHLLK